MLNQAIADRDMASMFAKEAIRTKAYNEGFFDGRKIGIEKTKEKLAEKVCRCKNRGFKHGWTKALQATGIDSALPLYQSYNLSFVAFEAEKTDDEDGPE